MCKVECVVCGTIFEKTQKRIDQTVKNGQKHVCSRKCASKLANDKKKCEPTTRNSVLSKIRKSLYPEQELARSIVRVGISSGTIIPPLCCELCGNITSLQAHHPDYSRPRFLVFLCKSCHNRVDRFSDRGECLGHDY